MPVTAADLFQQEKPDASELPDTFIPLDQLGKRLANRSSREALRMAEELYAADPSDAHYDYLKEARSEHKFETARR